jgi:hypothetical protein
MIKAINIIVLSAILISCSHKKSEDSRVRPAAPPVLSQPLAVSGVQIVSTVSEVETLMGPPIEGSTESEITLKLEINGESHVLNMTQVDTDEQMSYLTLGKYSVTTISRCANADQFTLSACSKFYFIAWVATGPNELPVSQIGVVKFLDGNKFNDGSSQYLISKVRPEPLLNIQGMNELLDQKN